MDFYITDRTFQLKTITSTNGDTPFKVISAEDVSTLETSSRRMTMEISFTPTTTDQAKEFFKVGNYVLYVDLNGKYEWMTILKATHNPLTQIRTLECEDAGLDLLNETVSDYKADKAYNIAYYINKFTHDSGFTIGVNEISNLTRKLEWEGEATALERIQSVATQFDNAELEFRFDFAGNELKQRYIDIKKKRGTTDFHRLYVNRDIHSIIVEEDIYQLVNAIYATGGTEEGKDQPINLKGFTWTDPEGRFVLNKSDGVIRDTQNIKQWSRDNTNSHYFLQHKQFETTNKNTLVNNVVSHLKKYSQPITNYIVDIANIPDILQVGDTVELVDENEKLYLSSRIQQLTFRYESNTCEAVLSDFVRLESGIAEQLREIQININNKTEQIFNSVPQVFVQPTEPENPKERDIWWVQTPIEPEPAPKLLMLRSTPVAQPRANEGDTMVTAYKVYKDGAWVDQTIDQSILNIETLNAVNINSSTINGSKFINTWNITSPITGGQSRVVGNTTLEKGKISQLNNTYITPTGSTIEKLRSEENTLIERGTIKTYKNQYDVETGSIKEHTYTTSLADGEVRLNDIDLIDKVDNTASLGGGQLTLQTMDNGVLTSNSKFASNGITVNGKKQFSSFYGAGPDHAEALTNTRIRIGPYMGTDFNTSTKEHNDLIWFNSTRDVFQVKEKCTLKIDVNLRIQGNGSTSQSRYVYTNLAKSQNINEIDMNHNAGIIHSVGSYTGQLSPNFRFVSIGSIVVDVEKDDYLGLVIYLESGKYCFRLSTISMNITKVFKS